MNNTNNEHYAVDTSMWPLTDPKRSERPEEEDELISVKWASMFPWVRGVNAEWRTVINPDIEKVKDILQKIHDNHGYCISYPTTDDPNALKPDMRCPCPDMTVYGKCQCGLFVKVPLIPMVPVENIKKVTVQNGVFGESDK